jgi:hypothetical protein
MKTTTTKTPTTRKKQHYGIILESYHNNLTEVARSIAYIRNKMKENLSAVHYLISF